MKKKLYEHTLAELLLEDYSLNKKQEIEFKLAVEELREIGFSYSYLKKFYSPEKSMTTSELVEDLLAMKWVIEETRRAEEGAKILTAGGGLLIAWVVGGLTALQIFIQKKFGFSVFQAFIVPVINLILNLLATAAPTVVDSWNMEDSDKLQIQDIGHYIGFDDDLSEKIGKQLTDSLTKERYTIDHGYEEVNKKGVLQQLIEIDREHKVAYSAWMDGGVSGMLANKEPQEELWTMERLQKLVIDSHFHQERNKIRFSSHRHEHDLLDWSAIMKDLKPNKVLPFLSDTGTKGPSSFKSIPIGFDRWFRSLDDIVYKATGFRKKDEYLSTEEDAKISEEERIENQIAADNLRQYDAEEK